jgi:hypothetical protein
VNRPRLRGVLLFVGLLLLAIIVVNLILGYPD